MFEFTSDPPPEQRGIKRRTVFSFLQKNLGEVLFVTTNCCGQQLDGVVTSNEWHCSGVSSGTSTGFVRDMDSGIDIGTLSKFADDTKKCGVVNKLEGRVAIHRDLNSRERYNSAHLMKFNKVKILQFQKRLSSQFPWELILLETPLSNYLC